MKYGITAALALATLAASAAAQAQDNESGFYAGAGVGTFDVEIDDFDDIDATIDRYDSDDTAWKAFGGWRMNRVYSCGVQKPMTRSTPARLYQERSNSTISPAAGRCAM